MNPESAPQKVELPEEYSAEWLANKLESRRQESISKMEKRKAEEGNPEKAEYLQSMIDDRLNPQEGFWPSKVFANFRAELSHEWLVWGTDEERKDTFKNMPGGDEVRAKEVQKWKDFHATLEKLDLTKERISQIRFRAPFSPEDIDTLGRIYFEMSKLGYSDLELDILG